jgi:hypothetical protein
MSDELAFKTATELAEVLRWRGDPGIERSGSLADFTLLAATAS